MFSKIFFLGNRGGQINILPFNTVPSFFYIFLICLFFFGAAPNIQGQSMSNCLPMANCSTNFKIEVVREFANVSSTCSANDFCGGGNQFYQIKYRIFLRYSANTPPSQQQDFDLQYKRLSIVAGLENLGLTTGGLSHIDSLATVNCYNSGPGANWNAQKVIFKVLGSAQTAEIDFMNTDLTSPCGTGGDAIHFTWGVPTGLTMAACAPSGFSCAYAELFAVMVNAYPGESIRVKPQVSEFIPFDSEVQQTCNPIPVENGNVNFNGVATVLVNAPMSHTNTPNANLLAEILAPVLSNGKQKFELRLSNTGTTAMTIKYLECVAQISPSSQDIALSFSGNHQPRALLSSGNNWKAHYLLSLPSGVVVNGGSSYTIGFIEVSPPNPTNQPWSVALSLIDDTKSRVRSIPAGSTSSVCTTLPLSGTSQSHSETGFPSCTSSPLFKIQPKDGIFDPCGSSPAMVQVGFDQINSTSQFNLNRFVFEIKFDLTGNLAITGVNFDNWISNWTCPAPIDNSCLPANSDGTCYDIVGNNVIRFCFSALGANFITLTGDGYINIEFNNSPGCITKATVTYLEVQPLGDNPCIPPIDNTLKNPTSSVCPPQVKGKITTEQNIGVDEVTVTLTTDQGPVHCTQASFCSTTPCSAKTDLTDSNGNFGFCTCAACNCFIITPFKNDNPLNGVTTYDLVLISKHILGIESFDSPYKRIAADANKSGSITTFDIVDLRKLILGITNQLPSGNTSWRFVPKSYTFPNPLNPFQTVFPELEKDISANGAKPADFWGIKVGDVNNTAAANRPAQRPSIPLFWGLSKTTVGNMVTIPIRYTGTEPLEAFQLGLRYDPSLLQLISPSQGDLPSFDAGSFYLPQAGEIRTLWLPMDIENPDLHIEPDAVLFNLSFKILGNLPESGLPLQLDDAVLFNAAWKIDGTECAVQNTPVVTKRAEPESTVLQAAIHPNPGSGEAMLHLLTPKEGKARIALLDAFGRRLVMRDVPITEGQQDIPLPETANLPAGVYIWKVYSNGLKVQGNWIKQ